MLASVFVLIQSLASFFFKSIEKLRWFDSLTNNVVLVLLVMTYLYNNYQSPLLQKHLRMAWESNNSKRPKKMPKNWNCHPQILYSNDTTCKTRIEIWLIGMPDIFFQGHESHLKNSKFTQYQLAYSRPVYIQKKN